MTSREAVFQQMYDTYGARIQAYCFRRLPSADANDAAAETFTVAWRRIDDAPEPDRHLPWLYGIARNVVWNVNQDNNSITATDAKTHVKIKEIKVGNHPRTLAIDPAGSPAMSYREKIAGNLEYAIWDGVRWNTETVDDVGFVGEFSDLAFDLAGNPSISYYDRTLGDLKYAKWNGSSWLIETVDSAGDVGSSSSLALNGADVPSIAYSDASRLKYAKWNGVGWNIEFVDPLARAGWISLALDGAGYPAIAYATTQAGSLGYAKWDGMSWSLDSVPPGGGGIWYCGLALDNAENPSIAYSDNGGLDLTYAWWNGTSWSVEAVAQLPVVAASVSLGLTRSGNPVISYSDNSSSQNVTTTAGSSWEVETIAAGSLTGWGTSLALDSDDNAMVGYYDPNLGALRLARTTRLRGVLYRGAVNKLLPGWQTTALPLDDSNDQPSPPFPLETRMGRTEDDGTISPDRLILYRFLIDGTADAGNRLMLVERPGWIEISF